MEFSLAFLVMKGLPLPSLPVDVCIIVMYDITRKRSSRQYVVHISNMSSIALLVIHSSDTGFK
jgi:hypothetical protein